VHGVLKALADGKKPGGCGGATDRRLRTTQQHLFDALDASKELQASLSPAREDGAGSVIAGSCFLAKGLSAPGDKARSKIQAYLHKITFRDPSGF
jgi:hypothetical protein